MFSLDLKYDFLPEYEAVLQVGSKQFSAKSFYETYTIWNG